MSLLVITISFNFSPLKDITIGGIIVVKNISGEPCEIVEPVAVKKSGDGKVRSLDLFNVELGLVDFFVQNKE